MEASYENLDPELVRELEAIASGQGCELVRADFKGGRLRLILDRSEDEGGVSVEDCATVSREVSALLDVEDFGTGRYTLEVSSPGLDRELFRPQDYERFVGHPVKVTFRTVETGTKRTVSGRLDAFHPGSDSTGNDGKIDVTIKERKQEEVLTIPLSMVQAARLEIEL